MIYKEDTICKDIKDDLPTVMQEEVEENFGNDHCTLPPKEWIDMI